MKRQLSILVLLHFFILNTCKSQEILVKDLSNNQELNYIFSRIITTKTVCEELYNRGLFVTIYEISDSKATPENLFKGYSGTVSSYIISASPDGDYYTSSKLHKIEGLIHPKIIYISETNYPNFKIKIEYGNSDERNSEVFDFEGVH